MHEAKLHDENVFVTLTYSDEHLPPGGSLRPQDMVDFLKRLRWHNGKMRYFQCGEYGEKLARPHHHALIFGMHFRDRRYYRSSPDGSPLFTSRQLDDLWGHGQCTLGAVSFESAAYVARYAMKKVTGPAAESHYGGRTAEYVTMSRRPGIGRGYIDRFRTEVYRSDSIVVRGVETRPPRYYDQVEEQVAPSVMERVKARRVARGEKAAQQDDQLREYVGAGRYVQEAVKLESVSFLKRGLEVT